MDTTMSLIAFPDDLKCDQGRNSRAERPPWLQCRSRRELWEQIMQNLYVSILLLFQTLTPTGAKAEDLTAALDLAQIKDVRITGEASRVEFTTNDTLPWSVAMTSIRSGCF
jgi:hypothetical protein